MDPAGCPSYLGKKIMTPNKTLSDWLRFTRKDRIGLLILLMLIIAVWLLPTLLAPLMKPVAMDDPVPDSLWIAAISEANRNVDKPDKWQDSRGKYPHPEFSRSTKYNNTKPFKGFWFDPNSLDSAGWRNLGLREKTVGTILRFRSKGGRFREAEDLDKIYGLFPDEVARLRPWVRIVGRGEDRRAGSDAADRAGLNEVDHGGYDAVDRAGNSGNTRSFVKRPRPAPIDLNTADTTALIGLPLIGSKLALRIIAFREKLGGFYAIEQLREVYGIRDSTFEVIRPFLLLRPGSVRPVNINVASIEQLKQHPYIRYPLASQVVAYRAEHGSFTRVTELKKMMSMDEAAYAKLEPYLVTN